MLVGSGSTAEPWSRGLHASQLGVPLAQALLQDLEVHAKTHAVAALLPAPPAVTAPLGAAVARSEAAPPKRLTPDGMMRDQLLRSQ